MSEISENTMTDCTHALSQTRSAFFIAESGRDTRAAVVSTYKNGRGLMMMMSPPRPTVRQIICQRGAVQSANKQALSAFNALCMDNSTERWGGQDITHCVLHDVLCVLFMTALHAGSGLNRWLSASGQPVQRCSLYYRYMELS